MFINYITSYDWTEKHSPTQFGFTSPCFSPPFSTTDCCRDNHDDLAVSLCGNGRKGMQGEDLHTRQVHTAQHCRLLLMWAWVGWGCIHLHLNLLECMYMWAVYPLTEHYLNHRIRMCLQLHKELDTHSNKNNSMWMFKCCTLLPISIIYAMLAST